MKLDSKIFLLIVVCFISGFLLCLILVGPAPQQRPTTAVGTTIPMLAFTQFQPQTFHIVLTQEFDLRLSAPARITDDPFGEIELMKHRSLHLIDTRSQPQIDMKELEK